MSSTSRASLFQACLFLALSLPAPFLRGEPRDIFILVDVSGSVISTKTPPASQEVIDGMINDAKDLVSDLVQGHFDSSRHSNWRWDPALLLEPLQSIVERGTDAQALTGPTKRIVLLPFGEKGTKETPVPHSATISQAIVRFPADFKSFLSQNYPKAYPDQNTYVTRGRAETARIAEEQGINQYYFLAITDAIQDPKGKLEPVDEDMVRRWESEKFVRAKTRIGLFEYRKPGAEKRNFQVDVWKVELILPEPPMRIVLTRPEPAKAAPGDVALEWALEGSGSRSQPGGYNFALTVTGKDGKVRHTETIPERYRTMAKVSEPGLYTLSISAAAASSKPGQITRIAPLSQELVVENERDSRIAIVSPPGDPVFLKDGNAEFRWQLLTNGEAEQPPGSFRISVSNEQTGETVYDELVSGYSKSVSFAFPKAPCVLRVTSKEIPGRTKVLPAQVQILEQGRIVLLKPEPSAAGAGPIPARLGDGGLSLSWAVETSGQRAQQPGNRFRVQLLPEQGAETIASQEVEAYETTLAPAKAGLSRLRIEPIGVSGTAVAPLETIIQIEEKPEEPEIQIVGLRNGSKIQGDKLSLRWRVEPSEVEVSRYRVAISGPLSFKPPATARTMLSQRITKSGVYRITISAEEPADLATRVQPAKIEVDISVFDWRKVLLTILGIGLLLVVAGFSAWALVTFLQKRKRQTQDDDAEL